MYNVFYPEDNVIIDQIILTVNFFSFYLKELNNNNDIKWTFTT